MVLTDLNTHTHYKHAQRQLAILNKCTLLVILAYSREYSEGDQGDGQTEDGDGTTHIGNSGERHLMALRELCRTNQSNKDYAL